MARVQEAAATLSPQRRPRARSRATEEQRIFDAVVRPERGSAEPGDALEAERERLAEGDRALARACSRTSAFVERRPARARRGRAREARRATGASSTRSPTTSTAETAKAPTPQLRHTLPYRASRRLARRRDRRVARSALPWPERFGLGRIRALLAVARRSAAALPGDPRRRQSNGKTSTTLMTRGAPAARRAARGRLRSRRTCAAWSERIQVDGSDADLDAGARTRAALRGRGDAVRGAHRRGARRVRGARRRRRGRRGRARRPPRRDERARRAVVVLTNVSLEHTECSARRARRSRPRSSRSSPPARRSCSASPSGSRSRSRDGAGRVVERRRRLEPRARGRGAPRRSSGAPVDRSAAREACTSPAGSSAAPSTRSRSGTAPTTLPGVAYLLPRAARRAATRSSRRSSPTRTPTRCSPRSRRVGRDARRDELGQHPRASRRRARRARPALFAPRRGGGRSPAAALARARALPAPTGPCS